MNAGRQSISIEEYEKLAPVIRLEYQGKQIQYLCLNNQSLWRVKTLMSKEPDTIAWIGSFQPGEHLVDIGANVGMYTVWAAVTRGVRVTAFEPESQNYAVLNRNIHLNDLSKSVTAYCVALSDSIAFDRLHLSYMMYGGSCHNFAETINYQHETFTPAFSQGCFSTSLDDMIAQGVIDVPDYIKIDVDGIEHKVINGMADTLRHPRLQSVLIEINTHLDSHAKIIDVMQEQGFTYDKAEVQKHMRSAGEFAGVGNYIFRRSAQAETGSVVHGD